MHVRYIGHSCLSIEMAGQRILTNPWWEGSAYDGLWCPHRARVEASDPEDVSLVFLTDEGEDHLHVPTLRCLNRRATILVPRMRDLSLRDFLLSLGFEKVVEMAHQRTIEVTPGLWATLYPQGEGNLLVLHGDGRTLVHANSAIQSGSRSALSESATALRRRHGSIDLLFASSHNHSWVPQCVIFQDATRIVPHEWDMHAASRFLDLVGLFEPRRAFPLEDPPRVLLSAAPPAGASPAPPSADERAERIQNRFEPGDCILDDQFVPLAMRRRRATPLRLVHRVAPEAAATDPVQIEERLKRIQHRILRNLRERAPRLLDTGQEVVCRIDLQEHSRDSLWIRASRIQVEVERCEPLRLAPVAVRLSLEVLESWVRSVAGSRSLTTAMGARWTLDRDRLPEASLILDLVGRRMLPPTWTERLSLWLSHPWRAFDIWRQKRLHRCGAEPSLWHRFDPYELLHDDAHEEDRADIRVA